MKQQHVLWAAVSGVSVSLMLAMYWYRKRNEKTSSLTGDTRPTLDYHVLVGALRLDNPQLTTVLTYLVQKSSFREHQEEMEKYGGISKIVELCRTTPDEQVLVLSYKFLTNVSTNPACLPQLKGVVPLVKKHLASSNSDVTAAVMMLLVNITSHEDLVADVDISSLPNLLSLYISKLNYKYETVLSMLKVLVNVSCSEQSPHPLESINMQAVVTSLIQLLYGCKNCPVLLRVLTILRNIVLLQPPILDGAMYYDIRTSVASLQSKDPAIYQLANQILSDL